jgi:hypothetical protein
VANEKGLVLSIPEQGIERRLDVPGAKEFFQKEQEFYNELGSLLQQALVLNNTNHGNSGLQHGITQLLRDINRNLESGSFDKVREYMEKAKSLSVVVGQGVIGNEIRSLMKRGQNEQAKFVLLIYSGAYTDQSANSVLASYRAAAFGHPSFQGGVDVISAKQALAKASAAEKAIDQLKQSLSDYVKQQDAEVSRLSKRYREEIIFDGPAEFWGNTNTSKVTEWKWYLFFFSLVAVAPLAVALIFPSAVHNFVNTVTQTDAAGGISLGGVAAITVPALFYAWLLKNLSRLFIQAHNLADDAAHRRALAIMYLGLADNKDLGMSEQERALILNALFRPLPQHGADEGPPNGLLDLIRGKP